IAYAKANPGKVNYASAGIGTPQHVAAELLKILTGINMVHVPYRGSAPALVDMLAGQVQVMIDPLPASIEFVRTGRLRPLAVTSEKRWPALPDVPTATEFVPNYLAESWYGAGVPRNTPTEIVDKLNREINAGLADARIAARIVDLGAYVVSGSPADFRQMVADEIEKWGKVVKASGAPAALGGCRSQPLDTPLALLGTAHLAISSGMNFARYSGLRRSGASTVTPTLSSRSRTAGESSASLVAPASRCTMTPGVPFGNTKAIHALQSRPRSPCPGAVGTFASTGGRVGRSVAIAFTAPASIWGNAVEICSQE